MPTYNELVLVARSDDARATDGDDAAALPAGARRAGYQRRARRPAGRASTRSLKADPDLDAGSSTRASRRRCRCSSPTDAHKPFGWQDPQQWAAYGDWMREQQAAQAAARRRPAR